ncbi:MAG: TonB-dependent receptor [Bacteroides sp.]
MKKIVFAAALVLAASTTVCAQSIYDAAKLTDKDLNGTARFVGMGGAMGALGGDISTIGTNPAGIGIFRSNDMMTSFSFSAYGTESKYAGKTFTNDKNRWAYDNIGFVVASKIGNETPLRYVNFGFNYKRTKSFYKNMSMAGMMGELDGRFISQSHFMGLQANDCGIDLGAKNVFKDPDAGWLAALGWNGALLNQDDNNIYHSFADTEAQSNFRSKETGGIDQYDFNVSLNLSDRVYLGLTIGAYDVNYKKYSEYDEDFGSGAGYLLKSWNQIDGAGVDAKFGIIVRPFEASPLRLGVAVHTPVFYNLTYTTSARLESDVYVGDNSKPTSFNVDTYDEVGDMSQDYHLRTPWKYNFSLGYTMGKSLALGAEYEYEDYSTIKFNYPEGDRMDFETNEAKLNLKGVHSFRVGAEYKVIPQFALRLGYNYSSAQFKDEALKYLPANSVMTDTDFSNKKARNNYTLGIGYRGSIFYADLAYQYTTYKEDFYPFYNELELSANNWTLVTPEATKVTNSRSQVLFTLGVRF